MGANYYSNKYKKYVGLIMKIIAKKKSLFLLITAYLLFYGHTNVYAEPQLKPIATVNLSEPPPPWEARPNHNSSAILDNTSTDITQQNRDTSHYLATTLSLEDTPDSEQSLSQSAEALSTKTVRLRSSGIAAWYRNRQHSQAHSNDFAVLEQQAMDGDINAQYQLGLLYYSGSAERPQNIQTAIQWLSRAAEYGKSDAQYSLGLLYSNDRDTIENQVLATKWLRASAEQGHVAAKIALIDYARSSSQSDQTASEKADILIVLPAALTTPQRQEQPQEEIRVASITAPPRSEHRRISRPSSIKNANQALNLSNLKQDAYSGDRRSQLLLGSLYEDGKRGVSKNLPKAAKWYRKAANQGYPQAQYNLGLLYEDGKGMTKNYHKATQWYKRAAKKGLSEAQNNLAVLYILGKGVAKDENRAETLFRRAAKQGNRNAIRNLNLLLEKN